MPNRLAAEPSPYLRQHADNPVDWHPWGEEAFAEARRRDVPIFLSVGYSACHWCHVMAHESFEDEATAAVVNERFVAVKVDREERPDVDAVYMAAVQAMTGQGGWPMTVFMAPDGRPFFGGTYFPSEARAGMPSFTDVCRAVDDAWRNRRDELSEQADRLTDAVRSATVLPSEEGTEIGPELLEAGAQGLVAVHDAEHGGFGRPPKFPQSMSIDLLLRVHHRTGDPALLEVVRTTLDAMAAGGIYDHLGGGFARYSTDDRWLVPHFEKMLYDQALLTRTYLHAWLVTGDAGYRQVVDETVAYVLDDLGAPGGGFSSAEDADSEGVEGRFYVWTPDEVRAACGDDAEAAIEWWGVTEEGSFEGANILHRPPGAALVRPEPVERARRSLLAARGRRERPGLDDKVLTEWNALFLASLAEAAAATGTRRWRDAAVRCAELLLSDLRGDDGRWRRSWQPEAGARHLAYAADHAALVDAFTRLAELTGEARWITEAQAVADALLELFWDDSGGGLFTTGHDAEALVARQRDVLDNATPSANSNAALALLRLAALTGEDRYREAAEAIVGSVASLAAQHPTAFARLLAAVDLVVGPVTEVAVVGERPDLVHVVQRAYRPRTVLAWGERYDSPLWEGRTEGNAYVCESFTCREPVSEAGALEAQLRGT